MMSNFLTEMRAEARLRELYRNPRGLASWGGNLSAPAGGRPSWLGAVLLKFGDLLIRAGTRLKDAARPRAVLSQEML